MPTAADSVPRSFGPRRAWMALAAVLVLVALAGALIVAQQVRGDEARARGSAEAQLRRIAGIAGDALRRGDYQALTPLLQQWGAADETIAAIRLTAGNGYVLARFERQPAAPRRLAVEQSIAYSYRGTATLSLEADLGPIERHRNTLVMQLGAVYLAVAALLVALARFALLYREEAGRHREARRGLEARDALLSRLSQRVPGVIYQYRAWPDGRSCFPYASDGIRDIYEVAPEEVREDATAVFGRLHPDDLAAVAASIQASRDALAPWRHEYRVVLPSRGERWLRGESMPERLEDGSTLWHGFITDVTEAKFAERTRRNLAEIVRHSGDFIGMAGMDGRVRYLNEAALQIVEWDRRQAPEGAPIESFLHESGRERFAGEVMPQVLGRGHWTGELPYRNFRTGEPVLVFADCFRIDDEAGRPLGIATVSRDMTESRRAQELLRRAQFMLENAPQEIWLARVDGRIVYANRAAAASLGYSQEELAHLTVADVDPEHGSQFAAIAGAFMKAGTLPPFETTHRTRDGRLVPREIHASHLRIGGEDLICGFATDLTERKRAEAELRMKDAGIAASMNGIAFAGLDGRLTYVNEAFVQLWRLEDASQAVGRTSQGFWRDPQAAAGALQAVVSGGRWSGELEGLRPDGSTFPVIVSAAPILDAQGRPFHLIGTFQDISDRKRAEEAVRTSEARLRAAQRLARLGSWERDVSTGVLSWSEELYRIFEYDPARVAPATQSYLERVHPEDLATVREEVTRWMSARRPYESRHRLLMPDGRVKHVHQISQVTYDAANDLVRVWGTVQDVTEVREAEIKLREYQERLEDLVTERTRDLSLANRELEAFASSVSHDLRAPLRGIDGLLKLLEEREGERVSPNGRELIGRVQAGARRMGAIIADLLTLARVTRAPLRREPLDLTALAHAVAADLVREDDRRAVEWRIAEGLRAAGDPGLVRLALENLLGNAWKYTGRTAHAVIEVGCEGKEGSLSRFFVRDNGAGFDMAHAGLLFQPFKRLHGVHEFEGIGVGLATVQRVVERHGGTVGAEGRVGEGACFRFTLPTGEEEA